MQTKREVLIEICETPGWQPPQPIPSSIDRIVRELQAAGWIAPRLDGWEATPHALDAYPDFEGHAEIHDPVAIERRLAAMSNGAGHKAPDMVSLDRVTVFILALMNELPLTRLHLCAILLREQIGIGSDESMNQIARSIAEKLR